MKTMLVVAALAVSLSPALGQQSQHTMVNANDVQWKDAPLSFRVRSFQSSMGTRPKRACSSCVSNFRRTTEFHHTLTRSMKSSR